MGSTQYSLVNTLSPQPLTLKPNTESPCTKSWFQPPTKAAQVPCLFEKQLEQCHRLKRLQVLGQQPTSHKRRLKEETRGFPKLGFRDITPIVENQMDKDMENEMQTGFMQWYPLGGPHSRDYRTLGSLRFCWVPLRKVVKTKQGRTNKMRCQGLKTATCVAMPPSSTSQTAT